MCTSDQQKPRTDVCSLCQQPLADGDDVVQIVQDRYPTYDREFVLHTYHKSCCDNPETVTHECPHCGSWSHIALLRKGRSGRDLAQQLFCPLCGTPFRSAQEGQSADEWPVHDEKIKPAAHSSSQGVCSSGASKQVAASRQSRPKRRAQRTLQKRTLRRAGGISSLAFVLYRWGSRHLVATC